MVHKTPVIISTDPGVDDIVAILLALASPELEILAFIASFGNTDADSSHQNILKAYQAVSRHLERFPEEMSRFPNFYSKVILARGSVGPLEGKIYNAPGFNGRDGLGEIAKRHPELDVQDQIRQLVISDLSGSQVVSELIRDRPARTITYIALGPLTDLARLMTDHGDLVRDRIGRIVCMGGALDVPGNKRPSAEFNFFADPYAVKNVLIRGDASSKTLVPLDRFILLPLDITTLHELPFPYYKEKIDPSFATAAQLSGGAMKSPLVHFTSSFLERTREVMLAHGKDAMPLHDIVAVWCAIENPPGIDTLASGWKARNRVFDIERTGELTRGMLVVDRRKDASAYAPGANRTAVQAELDKQKSPHATWESAAVPALVETGQEPDIHRNSCGVLCVHTTPGPDALLALLLERIWGIQG